MLHNKLNNLNNTVSLEMLAANISLWGGKVVYHTVDGLVWATYKCDGEVVARGIGHDRASAKLALSRNME